MDRSVNCKHASPASVHGFEPADPRYRLLVDATRRLMSEAGSISRAEVALLEERGMPFEELLEIIAIISAFTLATHAKNLRVRESTPSTAEQRLIRSASHRRRMDPRNHTDHELNKE